MTDSARVDEAFDALTALGSAWRSDWSDFDGRTLRDQLGSWEGLMRRALAGEAEEGDGERWLRQSEFICPVCRTWRRHCGAPAEHGW